MALRVWLPLNGNLENQGLEGVSSITGSPTYGAGKLGQAITAGGTITFNLSNTDLIEEMCLNKEYSIMAWCYNTNTSASSRWVFGIGDGAGKMRGFYESNSHSQIHWAFSGTGINITDSIDHMNGWHHICFTVNGTTVTLYIDGIKQGTGTDSSTLPESSIVRIYANNYSINDFRLYDECLSQKQIKEISKGLIAHYQLKTPRAIDNLNRGKNYGVYNNFSSSGSTCTVVKTGETYNGADVWRMTYTPNETSLSSVQTTLHGHGVISPGMKFLANTKYCFWTLFKPVSHPDTVVGGAASNIGYWTEIPMQEYGGGWYIVGQKRIGNAPEDRSDSIFTSFKTPSATSGTPIIIDFCCPHLVEGYDYILEEFDYIGTSPTYEIDSSGNGYNGTVTGTIFYNPDSVRYGGSTQFGGTCADYIYRPIFNFLTSPFTFNCWVYQTSATSPSSGNTGNTLQMIAGQGRDCGLAGFELCSANGYARLYLGTQTNGTYYTINDNTINLLNNWHMITGTFDGTVAKLYVDGTLKGTKESSVEPSWGQATGFVIGKMSYYYSNQPTAYFPFAGSISDVRIYATALSADDIKELYQTSGIIDNKGNAYSYEFKEE